MNAVTYKKDRKVLKRVDSGAAKNSLLGVLAALIVFALVFFTETLYQTHPFETMVIGVAIILVTAYRLLFIIRFEMFYASASARWRTHFSIGLLLHALMWGVLPAWLFVTRGPDFNFLIVLIYNVGVATALGSSWMSSLGVRQVYIGLILSPTVVTLLVSGQPQGIILAILIGTYGYYLYKMFSEQYHTFWHALSRERRAGKAPLKKIDLDTVPASATEVQFNLIQRFTHELHTPLNSLMGVMGLLKATSLNEEQEKYLSVAEQSGHLLLNQINDALDYSRVLTQRIKLNTEFFNLRGSLEQLVAAEGQIAHEKELELICVTDRFLPVRVRADEDRLLQVIKNLISNAIKFTDKGVIRFDVDYTATDANHGVLRFQVTDQGMGMPADKLDRLFDDQALLTGGQDAPQQTGGFGLLVCKGLVAKMKGAIGAESIEGEGSTFWFTVPVEAQPDVPPNVSLVHRLNRVDMLVCGTTKGTFACLQEEMEALSSQSNPIQSYDDALRTLRQHYYHNQDLAFMVIDTYEDSQAALDLCDQVLTEEKATQVRIILLVSMSQRGDERVLAFHDHPHIDVITRPLNRSSLRFSLYRLLNLKKPDVEQDKPLHTEQQWDDRKHQPVLLVEDTPLAVQVTTEMLEKLGYAPTTVSFGHQAVKALAKQRFELIFVDLNLPDMDGYDLAKALRDIEQSNGYERLTIIGISAGTEQHAQARCLSAGMDDYLPKPVNMEMLEAVLHRWLPDEAAITTDDDLGDSH